MRKIILLLVPFALLFVLSAGAQSLAEIAAQTRAKQKANPNAKVIDNDLLPSAPDAASYGSPYETKETKKDEASAKLDPAKSDEKKDAPKTEKKEEAKKDENKTPGADANQKASDAAQKATDQKASDSWKKKIEDQQKEVAQLQRELDVAQREARMRAAVYYADAGTMLRDQGRFAEDTRNLQGEIDAKTQSLNNAKQKLEDLQEQARRSGATAGEIENR